MLCAIIDTSGNVIEIGVCDANRLLTAERFPHTKENAKSIATLFAHTLQTVCKFPELSHVAVGVGPGTFIGTRTGVSFANGFAVIRRLKIISVGSMEGRGADFLLKGLQPIVIRSARRNSYYVGVYEEALLQNGTSAPEHEYEASLEQCLELVNGKAEQNIAKNPPAIVTDDKTLYERLIADSADLRVQLFLDDSIVSLRGMAYLAQVLAQAEHFKPYAEARYLRPAVPHSAESDRNPHL